jgi:hypothetical protein
VAEWELCFKGVGSSIEVWVPAGLLVSLCSRDERVAIRLTTSRPASETNFSSLHRTKFST